MTTVPRHGDIEIDLDEVFQRRDQRAQRIGRVAMALVVAGGLAGVFGGGLLSGSSVRAADGRVSVEYDRVARHGAQQPLRIHIEPRAPGDSTVDLWIDQRYMHGLVVREISPAPAESRAGDRRLIYRFRLADPSRSATFVFQAEADELWLRHGAVGIVNGDSVRFRQFVLP
jgi:hypothetical protein